MSIGYRPKLLEINPKNLDFSATSAEYCDLRPENGRIVKYDIIYLLLLAALASQRSSSIKALVMFPGSD
jgi:hypothetical protein